jgi:predicted ATPase
VEIDQVINHLRGARLLTITGVGGIGKTSLALRAAGYLINAFPDGVWLVELAPLGEPELVPLACAQALELTQPSDTPYLARLIRYLKKKHLLLILDSCEHLISACGELALELLKTCPSLTILATSRELLNLEGECIYRVPSMAAPEINRALSVDQMMHYDAVRLFLERARQASPDFSMTQDNAATVALICRRLDGIPLAIELAAARLRSLAVEQIAQRLEHAFNLLSGGSRQALPRQQTLKASIDWSYDLLTPEERRLLSRLSVFSGGWTLEAAEEVCAAEENGFNARSISVVTVLDLLARLVDKSLVQAGESGRETRYTMLDGIRQYAQAKLVESGDDQALRDRHQAYYCRLTARAEPHLRGVDQAEWNARLDEELSNLRLALDWSLARNVDLGLQIMNDSDWFWLFRGLDKEATIWLQKLLAVEGAQRGAGPLEGNRALQRARALNCAYLSTMWNPNYYTQEQKIQMAAESIRILRSLGTAARHELGNALLHYSAISGTLLDGTPEVQEMSDIFREFNNLYDFMHLSGHKFMEAY